MASSFCVKLSEEEEKKIVWKGLNATTGESNLGGDLTRPYTHTKKVHSRSFLSGSPASSFPFLVYSCSVTLSCGTAGQFYQRNRSHNSLIIQLHIHLTSRELKIFLSTKEVVGWNSLWKIVSEIKNFVHMWNIKL